MFPWSECFKDIMISYLYGQQRRIKKNTYKEKKLKKKFRKRRVVNQLGYRGLQVTEDRQPSSPRIWRIKNKGEMRSKSVVMCFGARRDFGSKKRCLHSIPLTDLFSFTVRPRTGGHMNSVMVATSSSTIWKVSSTYVFPKPSETCHGR